jgi:hypothetical protein
MRSARPAEAQGNALFLGSDAGMNAALHLVLTIPACSALFRASLQAQGFAHKLSPLRALEVVHSGYPRGGKQRDDKST